MKKANGYEMILLIENAKSVFVYASGLDFVMVDKAYLMKRIYDNKRVSEFEYDQHGELLYIISAL